MGRGFDGINRRKQSEHLLGKTTLKTHCRTTETAPGPVPRGTHRNTTLSGTTPLPGYHTPTTRYCPATCSSPAGVSAAVVSSPGSFCVLYIEVQTFPFLWTPKNIKKTLNSSIFRVFNTALSNLKSIKPCFSVKSVFFSKIPVFQ